MPVVKPIAAAALDDVGLHDELLGLDVGDVVDAGEMGVLVDLALGPEVLGVGAVPVEVVGATLSTAEATAEIERCQCSWKLDSSTASTS